MSKIVAVKGLVKSVTPRDLGSGGERQWYRRALLFLAIVLTAVWLGLGIAGSATFGLLGVTALLAVPIALRRPEWLLYLTLSVVFTFIPQSLRLDVSGLNSPRDIIMAACMVGAFVVSLRKRLWVEHGLIDKHNRLLIFFLAILFIEELIFFTFGFVSPLSPWGGLLSPAFRRSPSALYYFAIGASGALLGLLLLDDRRKAFLALLSMLLAIGMRTLITVLYLVMDADFLASPSGVIRELTALPEGGGDLRMHFLVGPILMIPMYASLFLGVFITAGASWRSRPWLRTFCLISAAAMILLNAVSGLRASVVALATTGIGLLVLAPWWVRNLRQVWALSILAVLGIWVGHASGGGRTALRTLIEEVQLGSGARISIYRTQIALFRDNPWFGTGFRMGHSTVLDWATGMGLVYLVPVLAAMAWTGMQLLRLLRRSRMWEERALFAGVLVSWMSFGVMSVVNRTLPRPEFGIRFWCLALIVALWAKWQAQDPERSLIPPI